VSNQQSTVIVLPFYNCEAWNALGDNLEILRSGRIPVGSVDLIYLDPPFNSNATYNILFAEKSGEKSAAQITAFEDTWHWGEEAMAAYDDAMKLGVPRLADLLQALRAFLGQNDMMAYLTMMAVRLVELHRVLKPTGSLYLHCDSTADHYLRLLLDSIFGQANFQNEIIWSYRRWPSPSNHFQRMHDIIHFYSKSSDKKRIFNIEYEPSSESYQKRFKGKTQMLDPETKTRKITLEEESKGLPLRDVWQVPIIAGFSKERLGYPTQKPEALLERIIQASSNEGDIVLDPFCGCGTSITVAERLKRRWLGIDITHLAIALIKKRLHDTYGPELAPYEVVGEPADAKSAEALAESNRHQFEWWALGLVDAFPAQDKKRGADKGVDGVIYFKDDAGGAHKKIIVQVKSGHVGSAHVRDLKGVLERDQAAIGALITLKPPTRDMKVEAAAAGFYVPEQFPEHRFPRLQILTIAELFAGKKLDYPQWAPASTYKKAARRRKGPSDQERQGDLL
jgi:site-specific DNA-methyltransferase (adenine-specific)